LPETEVIVNQWYIFSEVISTVIAWHLPVNFMFFTGRVMLFTDGFMPSTVGFMRSTAGVVRLPVNFMRSTVGVIRFTVGSMRFTASLMRLSNKFYLLYLSLRFDEWRIWRDGFCL